MIEQIQNFLSQFPPTIATAILAALPITELRLAIPIAIHEWLLNPFTALGWALLGNFIPFFPLYYGLDGLRKVTAKHTPWLTKIIDSVVNRAERRVQEKYARYGALALFLFTALPLPFTGLYTATLAAVALKVPVKYALIGVTSGILVAGIIVTLLSVNIATFF